MDKSKILAALFLLLLASCAENNKPSPSGPDKISLTPASFSDLQGWANDNQDETLAAFVKSCPAISHRGAEWKAVCDAAENTPHDTGSARAFFEKNFTPYAASGEAGTTGLFTGYYAPDLRGSMQQSAQFQTPLYAHPADLVDVDLSDFKKDLKGQHIAGKVVADGDKHKLKPYDERSEIARGSLYGRTRPIVWVADPVDAFFLAVQGSGRIKMEGGSSINVGYDGSNGRAYVAIGRAMSDMNLIPKPVTMQSIRAWLRAHPERADEIMNMNPSYVFFRKIDGDGPIGAANVAITPKRSMAVDPAFVTLGTPVWLETTDGDNKRLNRLMVAQDTGGAIKGAVRGDFFWGDGVDAERQAGLMQSQGRYYLLMPKTLHVN